MYRSLAEVIFGALLLSSVSITDARAQFYKDELVPIDNLFSAWRTLDTRLYIAQWAPESVKIDMRTGARQNPVALLADRTRLFGQIVDVSAKFIPKTEWKSEREAHVHVYYQLWFRLRSGKVVREDACENYLIRKYNSEWLIVRNEDYVTCRP